MHAAHRPDVSRVRWKTAAVGEFTRESRRFRFIHDPAAVETGDMPLVQLAQCTLCDRCEREELMRDEHTGQVPRP